MYSLIFNIGFHINPTINEKHSGHWIQVQIIIYIQHESWTVYIMLNTNIKMSCKQFDSTVSVRDFCCVNILNCQ